MNRGRIILVGGGVRSGKSAFALAMARGLGRRRVFVATARAFDEEMKERIAFHRVERGDDFHTIEEPIDISAVLERVRGVDVVVIDCMTLWLSNLLLSERSASRIMECVDQLAVVLNRSPFHSVVVTNEVGMGIVPESALARAFRDLCGLAHQRLAGCADEIHLAVLGVVLRIKPVPVRIQHGGARATMA